ncbi:hypothetical protein SLA2020_133460 [Shorea laevis]
MMHRCCSSQGNMVGPCSCGLFHSQSNSFSMLFSMPNHKSFDETDMYPFPTSSPSSSVDCTLSLGTPSTRLTEDDDRRIHHDYHVPNFSWDHLLQSKNSPYPPQPQKHGRGSNGNSNAPANDPLLARRCANCDTTSTPLWRNGPRGPKSLCNACGIRFKKEERRATAANANNGGATASGIMDPHHAYHAYHAQTQKMPCFPPANEFRFMEDDDHDPDAGIPYHSWRLNVTDRHTSLVHDFTR